MRLLMCSKKKDVGMGLLVYLYNWFCLYTAIPTPSFCGFWHCHPYIPQHFWKMFFILVCVPFLHSSTIKEDVLLASFFQNPTNTYVIRAAIATPQRWR